MRVFNVPASAPFLRTVIAALIDGRLIDGFEARRHPEQLARATLFLPTRRATRIARDVFLDVLETDAAILPRLIALGDIDEDELAFAQATSNPDAAITIPPALGALARRLTLARLIAAWSASLRRAAPDDSPLVVTGPASALALADDLARLMDDMETRGASWDALDTLVPAEHDRYWQLTLDFLKIARKAWPDFLAERGAIEPAQRRDQLIAAEAARLALQHDGPVIAAGSTGSMPATAQFLHAIAKLKNGAVVLPGLDTDLDDASWQTIGSGGSADDTPAPSHPQFALHGLLARFGLRRSDVTPLAEAAPHSREALTSETLRPSPTTSRWRTRLADEAIAARIDGGLSGLSVITAPNPEMEALAIAVAMRDAFARQKSASLVTPDRALARRVMAALGRWNLDYDDSGGDPVTETPAGIFARLVLDAIAEETAPAELLALLKHPLLRLRAGRGSWTRAIETLELALLRGTRPAAGTKGLQHGLETFRTELQKLRDRQHSALHSSQASTRLREDALDDAFRLIAALQTALKPLEELNPARRYDLVEFATRHRAVIEALSRDEAGVATAFENPDGFALASSFDELFEQGPSAGLGATLADYVEMFPIAFGGRIVRRMPSPTATLRIYGPLEARLTTSDCVILGGLIEGVWPPEVRTDPWLSRPMRQSLGLDLPERRIGLAAHDFAQLLGAPETILTHSAKAGGAPAVPSRFLQRLIAVAGETRWAAVKARGAAYLHLAAELDHTAGPPQPVARPEPRPPREARPLSLSITEIEDWLRDPYTIYARHILRLRPLDPVDMPPSAADRGSAIHDALGEFAKKYPSAPPPDIAAALREFGEQSFAPLMDRPEAKSLWWPRFLRVVDWFAQWDAERRAELQTIYAEISGTLPITVGERTFTLRGRADRIDRLKDGRYAIIDYKTGNPPSDTQVRLGFSPQMTLEAAMLRNGRFEGVPQGSVAAMIYVRLSGKDPAGELREIVLKKDKAVIEADDAAAEAQAKLTALFTQFEDPRTPYKSIVFSMWANRYGDYDDLARVKEWSATDRDGGGA